MSKLPPLRRKQPKKPKPRRPIDEQPAPHTPLCGVVKKIGHDSDQLARFCIPPVPSEFCDRSQKAAGCPSKNIRSEAKNTLSLSGRFDRHAISPNSPNSPLPRLWKKSWWPFCAQAVAAVVVSRGRTRQLAPDRRRIASGSSVDRAGWPAIRWHSGGGPLGLRCRLPGLPVGVRP
jgi:hypothetical protein